MPQRFSFLQQVQIQQLFSRAATQIPGRLGGQAPQINGVEIAAGGKHIGPSSGRRSRWSSRYTTSGGTADQGVSLLVRTTDEIRPQPGEQSLQHRIPGGPFRPVMDRSGQVASGSLADQPAHQTHGLVLEPGRAIPHAARTRATELSQKLLVRR